MKDRDKETPEQTYISLPDMAVKPLSDMDGVILHALRPGKTPLELHIVDGQIIPQEEDPNERNDQGQ